MNDLGHEPDGDAFGITPDVGAATPDGGTPGAWGATDGESWVDLSMPNLFSAEIENVDASDWDVDADLIWGEDGDGPVDDADPGPGFDLPM